MQLVPARGSRQPGRQQRRRGGGDGGIAPSAGGDAPSADAGTYLRVVSTTEITFAAFSDLCKDKGGFVATSAQCAGSNLCRGLSYAFDGAVLTDHSCKGLSSCAGMSCATTPADSGLSGEEIYEFGPCAGCHNDATDGASTYVVFTKPGETAEAGLAAFKASSTAKLTSTVAFGTQGLNDDGTQYSNMPSYRELYSRKEIEPVVEYLRTLETSSKELPPPGVDDGHAR